MPSLFDKAIEYILSNEGSEFTNDPADRGGPTKFGITLHTALLCPSEGIRTAADVEHMTLEAAKRIYYQLYWRYGNITDSRVATKLFDIHVNLGPSPCARIAQRAVNQCGVKIPIDSIWGKVTVQAINGINPDHFLLALVDYLHNYYGDIIKRNLSQARFIKGWLTRADRLPGKE